MIKNAVIYCRVSTDEQAKGYSLKTQADACEHFATEHGYAILQTFSDYYSGASLDRPELNRLREFISSNQVDVAIVYDIDRLARKSVYQMLIEEEFQRLGVTFQYVLGQYEDNDEGRLQKQIRASIAEYEKAKILERSKRGKRGKAKSGFVIVGARPPYGYKVVSEPHKAWLEIDEEEAEIVRIIYDWYINGDASGAPMSANTIAVRLTELGVLTRGDKQAHYAKKFGVGVWQRGMVIHILTNPTYTGTWHFGKTHMIDDGKYREPKSKRGLGKQVARAKEEWIPIQVPVIIDSETFACVQKIKAYKQKVLRGHTKNQYLLKGRISCLKCGYAARGQMVKGKHQYYLCNGRRQIVSLCDMPSVRGDWVDAIAWEWVKGMIENPNNLRIGLEKLQGESQRSNETLYGRLAIIDEQIQENQKQLDKLLDLYINGDFPKEMLAERKERLEQISANLWEEKSDLTEHISRETITDDQLNYIETFCAKIRGGLNQADFDDKRHIIELLDVRCKIDFENGEKVIWLKCLIEPKEQQQLLRMPTSPLSNIGAIAMTSCTSLPTARFQWR